jgi:hypothetical protein
MVSSIIQLWRQLNDLSPPVVHPIDKPAFADVEHTFNLDFPPPAYIGAIDDAICVVLYANGGYDPHVTPMEFRSIISPSSFLRYLHAPVQISPRRIAPYYERVNFGHLIESGRLALVNAVAYRSRKISEEPENLKLARRLPSLEAHRAWLWEEVMPEVRKRNRFLVVKRGRLWRMERRDCDEIMIFGGGAAVSPHLPSKLIEYIEKL